MRALFAFVYLLAFILAPGALPAQENQYTDTGDSDPEAIRLLTDLRKKYDAYAAMSADFRLEIAFPGQPVETQRGQIDRSGDRVRFKLGDQEGIINTEAAYIIQHANKEIMINNLPEPGEMTGMLTPQTLFDFYEGDAYVLAITGQESAGGRRLTLVELKPVDRDASEFTKLRLKVDPEKKEIVSIKAFSRDGSQFTFYLDRTVANAALGADRFAFRKADYPGYHVEDLRY